MLLRHKLHHFSLLILVIAFFMPTNTAFAVTTSANTDDISAAILLDRQTGYIIFEKNMNELVPVAGLSKLPALLLLTNEIDAGVLDLNNEIIISKDAASIKGPTAFLSANEKICASELYKSASMIAAGDSIIALGENLYGSQEHFLENIQQNLNRLSIDITITNSLGTDCLFSAAQLSNIACQIAQSKTFTDYSSQKLDYLIHENGEETELANANKLLSAFPGCIGLITGSSDKAGYCGIFEAIQNDTDLICIVLGAANTAQRSAIATELLQLGFSNYQTKTLFRNGDIIAENIPVENGKREFTNLVVKKDIKITVPISQNAITPQWAIEQDLVAPITNESAVGSISFFATDGSLLAEEKIFSQFNIQVWTLREVIHQLLIQYLHCQ